MTLPEKESRELNDLEQWQIEEIKKALEEADRGEFASDEEVRRTLKRLMRGRPTCEGKGDPSLCNQTDPTGE